MARITGKSAIILKDEFDFSGVTNTFVLETEVPTPPVTAFADANQFFVQGTPGFTLTQNSLHSTASPDIDSEMFTDLTAASRQLGCYPTGIAAGELGWEGTTNLSEDPIVSRGSEAIALNANWRGTTPAVSSTVVMRNTAMAGTTTGTAYNQGALTATESLVAVLRIIGVGGAGSNTLDVVVQSDDNEAFTSGTQRGAFAQVGTAVTWEKLVIDGAITDTWWRAVATYAGAGTRTYNIVVSFGQGPLQ